MQLVSMFKITQQTLFVFIETHDILYESVFKTLTIWSWATRWNLIIWYLQLSLLITLILPFINRWTVQATVIKLCFVDSIDKNIWKHNYNLLWISKLNTIIPDKLNRRTNTCMVDFSFPGFGALMSLKRVEHNPH